MLTMILKSTEGMMAHIRIQELCPSGDASRLAWRGELPLYRIAYFWQCRQPIFGFFSPLFGAPQVHQEVLLGNWGGIAHPLFFDLDI